MSIAAALVRDNAAAARLVPTTEGRAPLVDVHITAGSAARAPRAIVAGAVATACVGDDDGSNGQEGHQSEEGLGHDQKMMSFVITTKENNSLKNDRYDGYCGEVAPNNQQSCASSKRNI